MMLLLRKAPGQIWDAWTLLSQQNQAVRLEKVGPCRAVGGKETTLPRSDNCLVLDAVLLMAGMPVPSGSSREILWRWRHARLACARSRQAEKRSRTLLFLSLRLCRNSRTSLGGFF
jgi:hypothetical protein